MKLDTSQPQRIYEYEAFISYRHLEPDTSVAVALHQALERFVIPPALRQDPSRKKLGRVFRDQEELPTSSDLGRDIEHALENSKWLIIVCSPRLLESQWCMREVDSFIEQGRRDSILTLLVEGEPSESFPPQIRFVTVDGETVEMEPLAADVRAATPAEMKKRLKREKLRLLAPMLGVPFDALYQRAKKHARKKAAVILGIVAAALIAFGSAIAYQAMQTARANELAAIEQITKLMASSESFITSGQQNPAIDAAAQALTLAQQHGMYVLEAEAALYRALAHFPSNGPYAKLEHNADIVETAFSPDGSLVAVWTQDHRITVWDTRTAVKRYTVELTPDFFELDSVAFNMSGVETNWCSFCFGAGNELFVLDLSAQAIRQYGPDGTLLREIIEDFGCGVEYQTYASSEEFVLQRPVMTYLSGADAIVVSSYVTEDFFRPAFDAALYAYDAASGEKIYEHRFEPDSHYIISMQESGDDDSLACYFIQTDVGMQAYVLTPDVIRNGAAFAQYDFSESTQTYFQYLCGDAFLTRTLEGEYAVLDARTATHYPVPDIAPPQDEDDFAYMIAAPGGRFYAGFQSSLVNLYAFDGSKVSLVRTEVDIKEDTGSGTWISRFGWADKAAGTVTFICDMISESCRRVVLRDGLYYHDYQYDVLTGDYVFSDCGLYAETEGNTCLLYNLRESTSEYSREALPSRNQAGASYVDIGRGLLVAQNSDEGGCYFEICSFDGKTATPLHKATLPGTRGYNPREDAAPYHEVYYGEDYAAILAWQDANPAAVNDEDPGNAVLYTLSYADGTLRASQPWEWDYPSICAVNQQGVIVGTASSLRRFDPADPASGAEIDLYRYFTDAWREVKTPFAQPHGPDARSIVLWPFVERQEGARLKLAYIDLENDRYVESDTNYVNNTNDSVTLWSQGGGKFFAINEDGTSFNVYDIDEMTMLDRKDFPDDIVRIQKVGGNVIALISSQNAAELYDMDSCKKLCSVEGGVEAIQHISYNESNGLAVVSRKTGYEIMDVRNGVPYRAPVFFDRRLDTDQTVELYITDDGGALLGCTIRRRQNDAGATRYWYNYYSQDLMDAQTMLEAAQDYE